MIEDEDVQAQQFHAGVLPYITSCIYQFWPAGQRFSILTLVEAVTSVDNHVTLGLRADGSAERV